MIPALDGANTLPAPALPVLNITPTMKPSAHDSEVPFEDIGQISSEIDDPDHIAAIRVDDTACRAALGVAARPADPRRLN